MTERERLQQAYELAFHPPRLHALWQEIKRGAVADRQAVGALLDTALLLHLALPEEPVSSQRALYRLARYQARARAFGLVTFLRNVRAHLGRDPLTAGTVPPHLVRDIALPPFGRSGTHPPTTATESARDG